MIRSQPRRLTLMICLFFRLHFIYFIFNMPYFRNYHNATVYRFAQKETFVREGNFELWTLLHLGKLDMRHEQGTSFLTQFNLTFPHYLKKHCYLILGCENFNSLFLFMRHEQAGYLGIKSWKVFLCFGANFFFCCSHTYIQIIDHP